MRFVKMQSKDVVDVVSGSKIGYVSDLEIDERCQCIEAIIVERYSLFKLICFFKGPPVLVIPIENIMTIGDDVILVRKTV